MNENLRERDAHGYTVLHKEVITMALWGSTNPDKTLAYIESLITQDPGLLDIMDKKGFKPLCHAKKYGHSQLIDKLTPQEEKAIIAAIIEELNEIPQGQQPEPEDDTNNDNGNDGGKREDSVITNSILPKAAIAQIGAKDGLPGFVDIVLGKVAELKEEAKESASFLMQMAREARYTELHKMIKSGASFEDIKQHIDQGLCDVDERTPTLSTSLHLGAKFGRLDVVDYLLENGADPSFKNLVGNTPLHTAVKYGHTDIIKCLLVAGAEPDAIDVPGPLGHSPKDMAKANPELYELFEGTDVLHKPMDGDLPTGDNY